MTAMFLKKETATSSNTTSGRVYRERSLFPVLAAERLLGSLERQRIIEQVAFLSGLEINDFTSYYGSLLNRFAEFVQVIPTSPGGRLGSLINEGLRRGLIILQNVGEHINNKSDAQFVFAAFSAALLFDVGKVVAQQKIMISNKNGKYIQVWSPYAGLMKEFGEYYKMRSYGTTPVRLSPYVTPLLARQLLPKAAFLWIAENNKLLNMWLAALGDDEGGAGGLGQLLSLAKQILQQQLGSKFLSEIDVEITEPLEVDAAEDFHEWLKNKLDSGELSVNQEDSLINVVNEGVLIDAATFEAYLRDNPKYGENFDIIGLQKLYGQLGFIELHEADVYYQRYTVEGAKIYGKESAVGQIGRGLLSKDSSKKNQSVKESLVKEARNIKEGLLVKDKNIVFNNKSPEANAKLTIVAAATATISATASAIFNKPSSMRPGR